MAATFASSDKVAIVTTPSACGLGHYSTVALAEHDDISETACALGAAVLDVVLG